MRKILGFSISTVVLGVAALANAGSASALGGETLGCRVAPGTEFSFYQYCHNTSHTTGSFFTAAFEVQNESAPSTYTWDIPAGYGSSIYTGCTSSSNWCTLVVPQEGDDIAMSVVLTQGGSSETLTSFAHVDAFSNSGGGPIN